jgi:hypothetical protein
LSCRLAEDPWLCQRIAHARGWQPRTIMDAATDGVLGWSEGLAGQHEGALAFLYPTGIKQRWERNGERVIRWICGKPASLWRAPVISPETALVYLTEGETDALSLLDAGLEAQPKSTVAAIPSAGVVPWGLADFLAGRHVILCFDLDAAGRAATEKVTAAIAHSVASLKAWRPNTAPSPSL